jgi:hypothetical protein
MMLAATNKTKMAIPLAAASGPGGLLSIYALVAGIGENPTLSASFLKNFTVVTIGLYGISFLLTPKILIDMNFHTSAPYNGIDKYHEFMARFTGMNMLILVYALYALMSIEAAWTISCMWYAGDAFVGPTYAALYLTPKQAPMGHLPAHILMLSAGVIALLTTM